MVVIYFSIYLGDTIFKHTICGGHESKQPMERTKDSPVDHLQSYTPKGLWDAAKKVPRTISMGCRVPSGKLT